MTDAELIELVAQCVEDSVPACTPDWMRGKVESIIESAAEKIRDIEPPDDQEGESP